jgi:hypothetical protein
MFTAKSTIACVAACIGFVFAAEAQAQPQPSEPVTYDTYQKLAQKLIEAETRCWNGSRNSRREYMAAWNEFVRRISESYEEVDVYGKKFRKDFSFLDTCPPEKKGETSPDQNIFDARGGEQTSIRNDRLYHVIPGYGSTNLPRGGYGLEFLPDSERFVAKTDNNLQGYTVDVGIKPKNSDFQLTYSFTSADGSSSGQIASGTGNVGIVYNDFSPGGSTGIAIGASGLDVQTDTEYKSHQFELARIVDVALWGGGKKSQRFDFGVGARFDKTDHMAMVSTPTFSDISSQSDQLIKEKSFFLSAETSIKLTQFEFGRGISGVRILPRIEGGYRRANLDSSQINICGLCGASDQNFTINIEDKDSGAYFGAELGASVDFPLADNVGVRFMANTWWRSDQAGVQNPETGDDLFVRNQPTQLYTGDTTGYMFGAGLVGRF